MATDGADEVGELSSDEELIADAAIRDAFPALCETVPQRFLDLLYGAETAQANAA